VEAPTYLGALQALGAYEPRFCPVPCDASGPRLGDLRTADLIGTRLLYCIANFQNPTGRRMPIERRRECVELALAAALPIIEDDPYGALAYAGDTLPSLWSLAPDNTAYLGSFSKVLAPGLRVGYMIAPAELYPKLVQAKQAVDLHTSSLAQRVVFEAVKDGFLDQHIPRIRGLYAEQCRVMVEALRRELPPWVRWEAPQGGMFIWLQLPEGNDATALLGHALSQNLAFVPGATFFAERPQAHTLRLSFATPPPEKICEGVQRLGSLIRRHCHSEESGD
jgi:2-aminoadipate transaminase